MLLGGLDMALTKYKLGELIKQRREKYDGSEELPIRGVAREGFISPKQDGADLSIYNVYYLNDFVFNPARMELNSIALNTFWDKAICSSLYEIFYISRTDLLLPEYLNLFIKRDEFARKCWFEAVGSARNYFRVADLSEFDIELPDLPTQQKYVDIYKSMVANQQSYERGLEDLKLVFTGYIENLRRNETTCKIGDYITPYSEKNTDESITLEQGINIEKKFITPQRSNSNLQGRKIVRHGQFAYCTQLNNANVAIAYRDGDDCVVSSVYDVFEITRKTELLPEYLLVWLIRPEFGRYVYWASEGSAYEFLNYNNLANYEIPIPDIKIQKAIADIYNAYITRKRINEQLKAQIKDICPILIRGSLKEGR